LRLQNRTDLRLRLYCLFANKQNIKTHMLQMLKGQLSPRNAFIVKSVIFFVSCYRLKKMLLFGQLPESALNYFCCFSSNKWKLLWFSILYWSQNTTVYILLLLWHIISHLTSFSTGNLHQKYTKNQYVNILGGLYFCSFKRRENFVFLYTRTTKL
jgi:hypothetical protein